MGEPMDLGHDGDGALPPPPPSLVENPAARRSLHHRNPKRDDDDDNYDYDYEDDGSAFSSFMASSMVNSLLTSTSSIPVSGPSSPPLEQTKSADFVPPTRPSSTPFPYPEHRISGVCCLGGSEDDADVCSIETDSSGHAVDAAARSPHAAAFHELPVEVHEAILDYLFGYRVSITSGSAMKVTSVTRSWGTALRHSRRKELTELALVSPIWTTLIQQRLYRHVKLRASLNCLEEAMVHLAQHDHLRSYVKHIEIWFPVFQPAYGPLAMSNTLTLPTVTLDGLTNATYTLPNNNCTLEEVFRFVARTLPETTVLTLEGGERRKAPKVVHFHNPDAEMLLDSQLATLGSVQTLVTKGQWNLMRSNRDFETVLGALPNLVEWQGSYSKPKSKSYITVSDFIRQLPTHITNLNLCLESDYRREAVLPAFYYKAAHITHICASIAEALPSLENFSYTGRVCHHLFDVAVRLADPRTTKLKSVDITVKNCCRQTVNFHNSGSGIQDMAFIDAFEKLVLSAVRSLDKFVQLQYLRIRFVDLDSVLPPLNPYFLLRDGKCTGVWSDRIVTEMARVRPRASFADLCESFGSVIHHKEGRMVVVPEFPRTPLTSLKLSNYQVLSNRITIQ